jgi:hypothetical protein
MTKKFFLPMIAAVALLAACGEETRDGQLTLSGTQPVKIIDQGGSAVEFVSGPLKVQFGADSSRKFTVQLEQADRKAKFSGQAPDAGDWNFTVLGRDIGQPVDLASARSVALYGPVSTQMGTGGFCGMNGTWETEEQWQKGNEDWTVTFADAQSGGNLGVFKSRVEGKSYLLGTRNVWCNDRPQRDPLPDRGRHFSESLSKLQDSGVKFD